MRKLSSSNRPTTPNRFEAYRNDRLVAVTGYETNALNPAHLQALMANAQAGWGQTLKDQGKNWDRIVAVRINSHPL